MNKLEMAHQMACAMMASNDGYTIGGAIECAWEYADAMQKEWDERNHVGDSNEMASEWQPDWSQAPDDAVAWVYSNVDKSGFWCHKEPIRLSRGWCTSIMLKKAPSFNYQGSWQDSLRKRP